MTGEPTAAPDHTRRAIAIGLGGLVVGLAGGWMVASGAATDPAASPSSVSASSPATGTEEPTEDDDESLETLPAPTTTRPRPTTTTTLPEVATIALHPSIAGTDLRLLGVSSGWQLVDIDASTGEMITTGVSGGSIDPYVLLVGSDWVVTVDSSTGRSVVVGDDGVLTTATLGDVWSLLPIPGTDLFWRAEPTSPPRYTQVDLSGTPTGPEVTIPTGWASGADPAGGIVVVVQGATYSVDERGARQIADGEVIGLDAETAVLRTCDERLECGLSVVDRATGAVRIVDVADGLTESTGYYAGSPLLPALSPDGSAMFLATFGPTGVELRIVDLETGETVDVGSAPGFPSAVWTPDGRALLFVDAGGVPKVYDRSTGTVDPLAEGLGGWQRIAIRP